MKPYKIFITSILLLAVFTFTAAKKADAISIDEIKAQITVIIAKIADLQKQLDELKKSEVPTGQRSITLFSPNGGEKWEINKSHEIKWATTGYSSSAKVEIRLINEKYNADSDTYNLKIANTTNTGSYLWTIPELLNNSEPYGSLFKIAVYINESNEMKSIASVSYFEISKNMYPYLNIIYPNGGETLIAGKTSRIKWDSLGLEKSKISIIIKRNNIRWQTLADHISNVSYFDWEVPLTSASGNNLKINITAFDEYENNMGSSQSNNNFGIISPGEVSSEMQKRMASIVDAINALITKIAETIK